MLLLEGLAESGLDFVFKGGTSLMLKLGSTKRLSIDIDIIVPKKNKSLVKTLEGFVLDKGFTKVVLHERKKGSDIEKAHYKFFYTPCYDGGRKEDNILLDILFEKVQYQNIEHIDIDSSFVIQKGNPVKVSVPSFEDLLGDKLTAFAPETTGISTTFKRFALTELSYRNMEGDIQLVLDVFFKPH